MSRDDGHTMSFKHCDVCAALSDWPRRNPILGTCPHCGQLNEKAWRLAKAYRIAERKGSEGP